MPRGKKRNEDEIRKMLQTLKPVLERGTALTNALEYCQIPERTMYDYMEKYEWVRREVRTAENHLDIVAETVLADKIITDKSDFNARWRLERSQKEKYSSRTDLTTKGEKIEPVVIKIEDINKAKQLSDDELVEAVNSKLK